MREISIFIEVKLDFSKNQSLVSRHVCCYSFLNSILVKFLKNKKNRLVTFSAFKIFDFCFVFETSKPDCIGKTILFRHLFLMQTNKSCYFLERKTILFCCKSDILAKK